MVAGTDLGIGRPFLPDPTSRRFVIEFGGNSLISYLITNESYANYPAPSEVFTGRWLRTFSKSDLLDFTRKTTQYIEGIFGEMQHFEIVTQRQVIDVISSIPPSITPL